MSHAMLSGTQLLGFMPVRASTVAPQVDAAFLFVFWISLFFFVLIAGLMFAFIILYRRRSPGQEAGSRVTHNTPLEILWSVIPTLIVCVMFWWGFRIFMDMRTVPENAYEIEVQARKWAWTFFYPGGIDSDELHVPIDTPVLLTMSSQDVIHSCYIPAFRLKRDVVPGRYAKLFFQADKAGTYPLFCAEYCGKSHSDMRTIAVVHPAGEFEKWLETANPLTALTPEQYQEYFAGPEAFIEKYRNDPQLGKIASKLETPDKLGEKLREKKACSQCHTIDGGASTGPTWKGLFGSQREFRDGGSVVADENYIRESILEPNKHIVKGFDAAMPKVPIKDREIEALIAYIKTLK